MFRTVSFSGAIRKHTSKLFLLLFTGICSAQTGTVEISGRVTDNNYATLQMVNIQLVIGSDTMLTYTGADGAFSFSIIASQRVQLISSHVGFDTDYRYIDATGAVSIDIILFTNKILLGETVITARSRAMVSNSEFGVMNINSQKLNAIPSLTGAPDIIRFLQLMPGVQHSGEANGHLYVRGGEPGHSQILYNNTPVYGTSHLLGIFPFYNADHVDRIHFDKSGGEAQFGNRLGATVQCLSPDVLPDSFAIKGNIGLLVSQLTVSSPLGKKAGVIVSGRQTYIDRIIIPMINKIDRNYGGIDNFYYSFADANFTLMLRPNENHSIDVNVFASGDRFSIEDKRMLLDGKMIWKNQLASVKWDYQLKSDVKFSNEVYFSHYTNFLDLHQAGLDLQVESEVFDWGFNSGIQFKLFSIPFTAGVQYSSYRVKPQELSSQTLPVPSETNSITNSQLVSTYLQCKPRLNEYLLLDAGFRVCYYDESEINRKADFKLEPRVGLNFADGYRWTAYMSYARKSQRLHLITTSSVGFPTDFWIASSEGIPVELADNFSTGANYKVLPRLELTAGLFYSQMNNLVYYPLNVLQFNEITDLGNDMFTGKGKARGAELMIKKTGRLSGWVSYTWSKSDRQFDEINNGQSFSSKFDRRHNLSAVVVYEINNRWTASLTQIFTSGSRFTTPTSWYFINNSPVKEYGRYNNSKMPNYKRTDISIDWYIKKTIRRESVFNFSIYNLLAIDNPIYVVLDVKSSNTGNMIEVWTRYKTMYTILPSISWRFKF